MYQLANYRKESIIIIDEGYFQRILGVHERKVSKDSLYRFMKHFQVADIVLDVQNNENLFERYEKKIDPGNPRLKQNIDYFNSWKDITVHNYNIMQDVLFEMLSQKYVQVDRTKAKSFLKKMIQNINA